MQSKDKHVAHGCHKSPVSKEYFCHAILAKEPSLQVFERPLDNSAFILSNVLNVLVCMGMFLLKDLTVYVLLFLNK